MSEEKELNDDGLTLSQRYELEEKIVDTAFRNSFKIVTGRNTLEDLLDNQHKDSSEQAICAHQPGSYIETETLENMLWHFEGSEEYEKCAEIRDIINVRIQS